MIRNRQKTIYHTFIILTIVFVVGVFVFANLFDYSMDLAGAGLILSIFLSIVSFIVIFIFKKRSDAIDRALENKKYIARWHFSEQDWEKFIDLEYSYRSSEKKEIFFFLSIITAIVFFLFIAFVNEAKLIMLLVMISLVILYAFMAFFVPYIMYKYHRKGDAEVLILEKGILLNKQFHTWDVPMSELASAKIQKTPYPHLQIVYNFVDRMGERAYTIIVPIPETVNGEEVIERLIKANFR